MWLPLYFVISFVSAVWHVIFCMIHLIWPIGTFFWPLYTVILHAMPTEKNHHQGSCISYLSFCLFCLLSVNLFILSSNSHIVAFSLSVLALFFLPFPKFSCFCLRTCWLFEISYFHWWFWASLQWWFLLDFVCDIEDCKLQGPPPPPQPNPSAVAGFILKF